MQYPPSPRNLAFRVTILSAALFAALCAPSTAEECAPPRLENTVRMEPLGDQGLMMVPITLDGVEKKFLFDTGGVDNYVSSKLVEEFKLPQFSSAPFYDLRGNRSDSAVAIKDVTLGTVKASFVRFHVAPNLPYDGILAARTIGRNRHDLPTDDLDMDFGARVLNFYSADHCERGVVTWPHQALAVVSVALVQGHIELPVTLDGHSLTAAIDTGASWTNLNLRRAEEKLGFSPGAGPPQPGGIPRDDPDNQIYYRRYATLAFEGVTIANPLVIVRPIQFGGKDDPTLLVSRAQHAADFANRTAPDIIIGMEILRHLHLYYAVKEQKLYITPANSG